MNGEGNVARHLSCLFSFQRNIVCDQRTLIAAKQRHDVRLQEDLDTICQIPLDSHKEDCGIAISKLGKSKEILVASDQSGR